MASTVRQHLMYRARMLALEVGLSDDERRELAMMLPTRSGASGPVSWGFLTNEELGLLVVMLRGAGLVHDLKNLRV